MVIFPDILVPSQVTLTLYNGFLIYNSKNPLEMFCKGDIFIMLLCFPSKICMQMSAFCHSMNLQSRRMAGCRWLEVFRTNSCLLHK